MVTKMNKEMTYLEDDDYYKKRNTDRRVASAQLVSKAIDGVFNPDNVIDLGCGTGAYLTYFDVPVKGIDISKKGKEYGLVDIELKDLREPLPDGDYDVVLCIEVLEHIEEEHADQLVDNIVRQGDILIVTAAPPGQPGRHHVNCQPQSYWIEKFEEQGAEYNEDLVEKLKHQIKKEIVKQKGSVPQWIFNNLIIFTI